MIALISARQDPQFVPALVATPTAPTLMHPLATAAAMSFAPTLKHEQTVAPRSAQPLPGRPAMMPNRARPDMGSLSCATAQLRDTATGRRPGTTHRPTGRRRCRRTGAARTANRGKRKPPLWLMPQTMPRRTLPNPARPCRRRTRPAIRRCTWPMPSSRRSSGAVYSSRTANPYFAAANRSSRAPTCFDAGCPETGSVVPGISASTRAAANTDRSNASARTPIRLAGRVERSARTRIAPSGRFQRARDPRRRCQAVRVCRMDFDERLGEMLRQARLFAGARHRVPLVAHAAGIEHERKGAGRAQRYGRLDRHEPRLAVRCIKPPSAKIARRRFAPVADARPLERLEVIELPVAQCRSCAPMSKSRVPSFSKPTSAACSAKISAGLS